MRFRNQFLVFLDNISLVPLNPDERLCDNWQEVKQQIYDQNERHQYLAGILKSRPASLRIGLQSTTVLISDTLILPDVLFATGKKDLNPSTFTILDSFCKSMTGKMIDSLVIEGHADNTGTDAINEQLSAGRAGATASYLGSCNPLSKIAIITRGWGRRRPIAPNDTPANRQRNRRVELRVYFRE
jgi:outer membrane protein OmpA-like peptidoglycan-associated protein